MTVGPWIARRLVEYGHGFHPFGQPSADELRPLVDAMAAAGRSFAELERSGGCAASSSGHSSENSAVRSTTVFTSE